MRFSQHESNAFRLIFGMLLLIGGASDGPVQAEDFTSSSSVPTDSAKANAPSSEVISAMEHLEPLWESMRTDIVSCEATFRMQLQVIPAIPLTRLQVHEMLSRYELNDHIERAPELFQELMGAGRVFAPPVRRYFEQGPLKRCEMNLLSHFQIEDLSLISDGDNKQVRVYERGLAPSDGADLGIFRFPLNSRVEGYHPDLAKREGALVRLTTLASSEGPLGHLVTTNTLDWATGILVQREQVIESELVQESVYFGLTTFAGGITFPRCAIGIHYAQGKAHSLELALLDEAKFNEPLPDKTFHLPKPPEWYVMDCRTDAGGIGIAVPREAVANVRTLIPASLAFSPSISTSQPQTPTSMSLVVRLLLILNGAILIAIGIWMWKHASLKEQKH